MKKKKSIVIGATSLLLVTLILLGLTYAYYKTKIVGNTYEKSVSVTSKNLSVTYQNESAEIIAEGIEPGYTATKTFEVKNTGSEKVNYSVMFDNVENTFTRTQDWTYAISESGTELKSGTLPNSNSYILYSESIDAGATKSYTLKIDYANLTDVDQSDDMGASLSYRINISDSLGTTLTSAGEGTLLYAIGNDNVVSDTLTTPGKAPSGIKFIEDNEIRSSSNSIDTSNKYFIYADSYEFDESGYYILNNPKIGLYSEIYNDLVGKYVVNVNGTDSPIMPSENAGENIYKFISATSDTKDYTCQYRTEEKIKEEILSFEEDDYGTSYYFRGDVTNNYVNYSGMCWRIVRVQGDGTIKIILDDENGECNASTYETGRGYINGGTTYAYNDNDLTVNYLTGNIPSLLNEWITSKSLDTSKLVESVWCSDTSIKEKMYYDSDGNVIDGSDSSLIAYTGLHYGAYIRLYNRWTANPSLKCDSQGLDATSANKLTSNIGILSIDEVAFAGGIRLSGSGSNYLQDNKNFWTLSPSDYNYSTGKNRVFRYLSALMPHNVTSKSKIRPVVVLESNVLASGSGTQMNPYIISSN